MSTPEETAAAKGPPPCDLTVIPPEKDGSRLMTRARITCSSDQWLNVHIRITHHKRLLPDETIASHDEVVQVGPGEPYVHELRGKCKSGAHQYFAKVTAQSKSFSEPAEFHTSRVEISC